MLLEAVMGRYLRAQGTDPVLRRRHDSMTSVIPLLILSPVPDDRGKYGRQ